MPKIIAAGLEIDYEFRGPGAAPVIVFVNALGATKEMWREQTAALTGRYRCLTYDANGHGASGYRPVAARIESYADDLRALMDALAIGRADIVGASLGGMTAQAFAVGHPERVGRLVLVTTTAKMADRAPWFARADEVRRSGLGGIVDAILSPRWFTPGFVAEHAERVAETRRHFLATRPEGYATAAETVGDLDLREAVGGIAAPTLILASDNDPATPPAMSVDLKARIKDARLVVLPGAAHMVGIERAGEVNAFIGAFLGEASAAATPPSAASVDEGFANRRAVLGDDYVAQAMDSSGDFGAPWQDFVSRMAWGEAWGDPALSWKTRSLVTLAILATLGRQVEFRLHLRGALRNGATRPELQALLRHIAIYAGAPAGNNANRWAVSELGEAAGEDD